MANDYGDDDENSEVEFPVPKGYTPPTDAEDGKEFTVLASFQMKDDGKMCLTKIENIPVGEEESEDEEGPETSPELMKALTQPEATNASTGMPAAATY
jgi:hypothetical protein